jgi:hypothetical protein
MRSAALMVCLAVCLVAPPAVQAKGGSDLQPRPNKDFRELIVKGERPEIAACLTAAVDYARHDTGYSAIRWDDDASDRAIMRETESQGRLTRYVRLVTQMETQGSLLSAARWRSVQVTCEQPEDGEIHVEVAPLKGDSKSG